MVERVNLEPGFILHRKKFKEKSFIIDIFTASRGKIRAISKSIAKNNLAYIQPFVPCFFSWSQKTELATLYKVEYREAALMLGHKQLVCAFYINELIMKLLTSHDPAPQLFYYYELTLKKLAAQENIEVCLRIFEKNLLEEVGYGIPFNNIINSSEPAPWYEFCYEDGFIARNNYREHYISYEALVNFAKEKLINQEILTQCKILTRQALAPIMAKHKINSKMFFIQD